MPQQSKSAADILEDPESGRADFQRARATAYAVRGEMAAVEAKVEALRSSGAQRSTPKREAYALQLGVGLWILDQPEEAVRHLESVKSNTDAVYILGRCLMDCGRAAEAGPLLEQAAKNDRDSHDLRMAAAEAHRRAGEFSAAKRIISRVEDAHQEDAEIHYQRARCLEVEGEYEKAIEDLRGAVELDPNHAAALFRLGYACDLRGLDDAALEYYERCVALRPTFTNALLNLGLLHEDLGQWDKAIECYKRVLAAEPTHTRARLFLRDAVGSKTMYYDEETERRFEHTNRLLRTPVVEFEFSVRSRNCLEKMNLRTLGDLVRISEEELLSYKNFGETSLTEIKQLLASKGLSLGMSLETGIPLPLAAPPEEEPSAQNEMLLTPVDELELSVRSRRCMLSLGIQTLGDLTDRSPEELLRCKNFGQTSLAEVREKLQVFELGLTEPAESDQPDLEGENPAENV